MLFSSCETLQVKQYFLGCPSEGFLPFWIN
jgi:hypothetical protein